MDEQQMLSLAMGVGQHAETKYDHDFEVTNRGQLEDGRRWVDIGLTEQGDEEKEPFIVRITYFGELAGLLVVEIRDYSFDEERAIISAHPRDIAAVIFAW
jgi:hypothetical protein